MPLGNGQYIICFKQEKGLKNCSNRQLKVTAKHKIYPDGQKNAHLENRRGVGGNAELSRHLSWKKVDTNSWKYVDVQSWNKVDSV